MSNPFLDKIGYTYTMQKLKAAFATKADKDLSNVDDAAFAEKANAAGAGGIPEVAITSTDGVTYTGTMPNLTALTNGLLIKAIPNKASASTSVTLNLNSLGAKNVIQSSNYSTGLALAPAAASWMAANKPVLLMYDGIQFKTVSNRTTANDMYGTVKVTNGGTGANNAADALVNLGITAGTADLTPGVSELAAGAIYLVYEE